tara:strand:- start:2558 stop:3415 length:858 start_codon:yes stop_codon:yes gene_type:complete
MINYNKLTVFFVSYFSKKKIEKIIKKLDKKIKILIIDNANEVGIKKYFENKYKNTKVICNKHNSGQTGGINTGLKNINTKYSIYMDADISFKKNTLINFLIIAEKVKNFIILAPQHEKSEYIESFKSKKKNKFKNLILMKIVHGHFLLFNMKAVKKFGYYDEKIFLYYDETDYCLRAYKKNYNIYVLPKEKVKHEGGKSVDIGKNLEVEANKHWHFMWSKFYFYKKHYSTFYAYKQTLFDLIKIFTKVIIFSFIDVRKRIIYYNQLKGLINSYIGNKSFKRLKIN